MRRRDLFKSALAAFALRVVRPLVRTPVALPFEVETHFEFRTAGVVCFYPASIRYLDGI